MADKTTQQTTGKHRPLLHIDDQLDHLADKGVSFDLCPRDVAADYLRSGNNLFRASAYRKLFPLQNQGEQAGRYLGLDFEHLRVLSSLDRKFRQCFLSITIDVEHFARIKLLNACEVHGEDGYTVVADFLSQANHKMRNRITGNLEGRSKKGDRFDEYSGHLIAHYLKKRIPIWVFLEIIEFGTFNSLFLFCAERWNDEEMRQEHYVLRSCQMLRNACAHNSCILNGISRASEETNTDINGLITDSLNKHGLKRSKTRRARLNNLRTAQMASALYASKRICTREKTRARHSAMLAELRDAWRDSAELFTKNNLITSFFDFFFKIVDVWAPEQA